MLLANHTAEIPSVVIITGRAYLVYASGRHECAACPWSGTKATAIRHDH